MYGNHAISYEYRNLKEHKRHHLTHYLDLSTIMHALKMWQHYLIGQKFLSMSNNISLKYILDKKISMLDRKGG
jgi:hypothetical protein